MRNADSSTRRSFVRGAMLSAAAILSGCHGPVVTAIPPLSPEQKGNTLRQRAAEQNLLFGFAVTPESLRDNEGYRETVLQQASIVVAENAMKWGPLRPSPDSFYFDDSDYLVGFASANGLKIRGHNLCWHEQLPNWFHNTATAENARQLLTDHIRTVAGRYRGRMHSWDVVNEAVWIPDGRPDGLRNSPWMRLIGSDYIELAFRTARQADPSALLTYNEYGIEADTEEDARKRAATLLLLRGLKQRNVPLDAVGVQSHIHAGGKYGSGLQAFLQSCRELGLQVFVTEMDVNDRTLPANIQERDKGVAQAYGQYLDCVLAAPNVRAVLTWGVNDRQSWLSGRPETRRADGLEQRPLLFDDQLRPKPDFLSVRQAFADRTAEGVSKNPDSTRRSRKLPRL